MGESDLLFGIPEIDEPIATALPPGWFSLLTGSSASGAPLLAKQFAHAGVGSVPVLFYTTYERTTDVKRVFEDFGWDPSAIQIVNLADEYYERVLVRGLEVATARERGLSLSQLTSESPTGHAGSAFSLTSRMLSDLAAIDTPFRLVLDSVDFFFEVLNPADVTTVARQIRYRCQTIGGHALLSVHSRAHDPRIIGALEDLADVVVDLRATPRGRGYEHTLYVEKVRNRPDLQRIARARVTEQGWQVDEREEPSSVHPPTPP
ncbi:MAG TPA: RAD55 family ATPase [Thermoplasmata archaeon]|nr:RAD55 family ATPase [Thermoplasmata archaeon]